LILVKADFAGLFSANLINIGGEVVENFERQVSEGLLGALDALTGVRFRKADTQIFSSGLQLSRLMVLGDFRFGLLGEGVEECDAIPQVLVVNARFESELMFHGTCESNDEVESSASQLLAISNAS
jgi:hypothetical protein